MQRLIDTAKAEIGYLEKKTNAYLESKTGNAGKNNFTKYGKAQGCNGQPWCDAFVDWCFIQAYGKEEAKKMLGGFSNYTPTSAQYFKNMKKWFSSPKVGDVIFFKNSTRIYHTGIVYKVDSNYVYTIEGNTSTGSSVVANGGGVCKKSYLIKNKAIAGYGRPSYPTKAEVKEEVKRKTLKLGSKGAEVKELQTLLNKKGYSCGKVDGEFGKNTKAAVLAYQIDHKDKNGKPLEVDGVVGEKTWYSLLN